jgi:predicted DNA-binding WGR domain protein
MKMKRMFSYKHDKSGKFWAIETQGTAFTVTFGKTGTDGQKPGKSLSGRDFSSFALPSQVQFAQSVLRKKCCLRRTEKLLLLQKF